MERSFKGLSVVGQGKSETAGGIFQYKVDQTPANYTRAGLFGKYNLPASQEYYKKQDDKQKGKKSGSREGRYTPN